LRYLRYLLYWTTPTYAKFVAFPHALYLLQLLQKPQFRTALKSPQYHLLLHQQQGYHWQFSGSAAFRPRNPDDPLPQPLSPEPQQEQQQNGASSITGGPPEPLTSPNCLYQTPVGTPALSQGYGRGSSRAASTPGSVPHRV
jgi:SOH1